MRSVCILICTVAVLILTSSVCFSAQGYKIGVLAKRGPAKALEKWSATGDYLTAKTGEKIEIVPLAFDDVNPAIAAGKVDFFLVNSSMFVTAKVKYGAVAIATLINSRQGKQLKSFGGVILASTDNDTINDITDLKQKNFMAVKESSFGGWQMAYNKFKSAGINPYKDFASVKFGEKHDNVVLAVQNGVVDAGTVRTDTLERMAAEGIIYLEDFKIIGKTTPPNFPFFCSTILYPEWPLAKVTHTPDEVASKVTAALKQMKSQDKAAVAAKIVGWVDPLDYKPVEDLQKKLKIGAYKE